MYKHLYKTNKKACLKLNERAPAYGEIRSAGCDRQRLAVFLEVSVAAMEQKAEPLEHVAIVDHLPLDQLLRHGVEHVRAACRRSLVRYMY